ncbi:EF-hand domain-containing protein 1 [Eurytemora carolleeae]|uniref:EF-hand domain-containing protein 1 n=1 Tax=Eurytemora carolleeae TaxID=1294199 RepID=UPI000C75751D|nr:EF-hand domain-containing protein 1 [Eurytemora carolleeae]|eukprot:XP_023344768.1 EF-hand domain-containing protein 1-like [Eurytemora affinis]
MPFPEKNPPNVPILPGPDYRYTVGNLTIGKLQYHRSQSLGWRNGCRVARLPGGIGGDTPVHQQLPHSPHSQLMNTHEYPDPEDVAGLTRYAAPPPFVPKFCTLDKKVLRFCGHFREKVGDEERVRYIQLQYHLQDDTITLIGNNLYTKNMFTFF